MMAQGKYTHVLSHGPSQTHVANYYHGLGDRGYGEKSIGADEVDVIKRCRVRCRTVQGRSAGYQPRSTVLDRDGPSCECLG